MYDSSNSYRYGLHVFHVSLFRSEIAKRFGARHSYTPVNVSGWGSWWASWGFGSDWLFGVFFFAAIYALGLFFASGESEEARLQRGQVRRIFR